MFFEVNHNIFFKHFLCVLFWTNGLTQNGCHTRPRRISNLDRQWLKTNQQTSTVGRILKLGNLLGGMYSTSGLPRKSRGWKRGPYPEKIWEKFFKKCALFYLRTIYNHFSFSFLDLSINWSFKYVNIPKLHFWINFLYTVLDSCIVLWVDY